MHRLLKRQLKKLRLDADRPPDDKAWRQFLKMVDGAYRQADQDRYTLERSLSISSEEMQSLYQRLKTSTEARMHAVAEAFPDLLFFQDEDGRFLDVLAAHPEMLYVPREQIIGHTMEDIFSAEYSRQFRRLLQKTLETGKLQQLEYHMPDANGEDRLYEARVVPMGVQEDGKRALLTVVRDITVARREETWAGLVSKAVSAAREGIIILDQDKRVISANPAIENICRRALEEVLNKPVSVLSEPDAVLADAAFWREVDEKGSWHGEIQTGCSGGTQAYLWLSIDRVQLEAQGAPHYVMLLNDISELHASRKKLEKLATQDPLTGLPNRVLFQDRLEQALVRSARNKTTGALLFLDLDRFKIINDSLGHQVGDLLLQAVAERLSHHIREMDTLARMGGDEFTLILEDLRHPGDIVKVLEKLLQALRKVFKIGAHELRTTASIGVSIFPRDGQDADELIKHADTAMYSAKDSGGDQYRLFTEKLTLSAYSYFDTEQGLHNALERREFYLLYQPQYELATGSLIGVEALLRWHRPGKGMIGPDEFIPMAEMIGLIEPLGAWVREAVCQQIVAWRDAGTVPPRVAVNISSRELVNPGLNAQVANLLARYRVPAELLEFEITESAIIKRGDVACRNLLRLTEMGIELAIDDFGTGHSSLVNLKRFPLTSIKIDRSFIRDVLLDPNDEAIVRATIVLAKSFGMQTIAEGVENVQQLDFLRRAGCEVVQGFLCGKPMSPKGISDLMQAGTPFGTC